MVNGVYFGHHPEVCSTETFGSLSDDAVAGAANPATARMPVSKNVAAIFYIL
jgi:hypothetical protein